jgi:flagellar basal-body rod modification protein FlgD
MVTATTATPSTTTTRPPVTQPSEGKGAIASDFNTFLKMLTAQIQNQDPLSPMKSEEFAVQLATFSSVEQQVLTNDLLKAMGGQFSAMGMAQFATWVGMEGRTAAPVLYEGRPVTLAPNPVLGADRAELVVRDANGTEIERREIAVSSDPVEWTGLNASGEPYLHGLYSFELVSFQQGVPIQSDTVEAYSRITEVRGEDGGTMLVLAGGSKVPASEITALRQGGTN